MSYQLTYVRRPRVQHAWGKRTKTHVLHVIVATPEDARTILRAARRWAGQWDTVLLRTTDGPITDVSVEDACRGLRLWKER